MINGVTNSLGAPGDYDVGIGTDPNGPYINKPDDGNASAPGEGRVPYIYYTQYLIPPGETFSSPSRQISSPVMFGSLPTGVKAGHPWQTLLFCPNPAAHYGPTAAPHPGLAAPRDHLLLDLFHMPVVEPYAISEPFSTAGKVNMNAQLIPFTGIERSTALHGVLQSVKITAFNNGTSGIRHYKKSGGSGAGNKGSAYLCTLRYPIDIPQTLRSFETRYQSAGKVFLTPSEICDIPLVPDVTTPPPDPTYPYPWPDATPVTLENLDAFWEFHRITGDNQRENPYSLLYPRLTTRSNTYTVHLCVETLQKRRGGDPARWEEGKDRVTSRFRGAYLIERYMDPADPIPDYVQDPDAAAPDAFYKFRVIHIKEL